MDDWAEWLIDNRIVGDCAPTYFEPESAIDMIVRILNERYAKRAITVNSGRNRNVFLMPGNYVVKVPRNLDGCADNSWEGSVSNQPEAIGHPWYIQYPKARLAHLEGVPVTFMEKVRPVSESTIVSLFGDIPDWVASVDCQQVGVTKKGRLVAYDYGIR